MGRLDDGQFLNICPFGLPSGKEVMIGYHKENGETTRPGVSDPPTVLPLSDVSTNVMMVNDNTQVPLT